MFAIERHLPEGRSEDDELLYNGPLRERKKVSFAAVLTRTFEQAAYLRSGATVRAQHRRLLAGVSILGIGRNVPKSLPLFSKKWGADVDGRMRRFLNGKEKWELLKYLLKECRRRQRKTGAAIAESEWVDQGRVVWMLPEPASDALTSRLPVQAARRPVVKVHSDADGAKGKEASHRRDCPSVISVRDVAMRVQRWLALPALSTGCVDGDLRDGTACTGVKMGQDHAIQADHFPADDSSTSGSTRVAVDDLRSQPYCLAHNLVDALKRCYDIRHLFHVQTLVIPRLIMSLCSPKPADVCVLAPTGSGKTLAIVIPVLHAIMRRKASMLVTRGVSCIVAAPKSLLAQQLYAVFYSLSLPLGIRCALCCGTQSLADESKMLYGNGTVCDDMEHGIAGSDIVICTPDALIPHLLGLSSRQKYTDDGGGVSYWCAVDRMTMSVKGAQLPLNANSGCFSSRQSGPKLGLHALRYLVFDEVDEILGKMYEEFIDIVMRCLKDSGRSDTGPLDGTCLDQSAASRLCGGTVPLQKVLMSATLRLTPHDVKRLRLHAPVLVKATSLEGRKRKPTAMGEDDRKAVLARVGIQVDGTLGSDVAAPEAAKEGADGTWEEAAQNDDDAMSDTDAELSDDSESDLYRIENVLYCSETDSQVVLPETLTEACVIVEGKKEKIHALVSLLGWLKFSFGEVKTAKSVLLFTTSDAAARHMVRMLELSLTVDAVVECVGAHATESLQVMEAWEEKLGLLVCVTTDEAARGIDFPNVDVVVQYSCPMDVSAYVHRAGRTARSGRRGASVCLVASEGGEEEAFVSLATRLGKRVRMSSSDEMSIYSAGTMVTVWSSTYRADVDALVDEALCGPNVPWRPTAWLGCAARVRADREFEQTHAGGPVSGGILGVHTSSGRSMAALCSRASGYGMIAGNITGMAAQEKAERSLKTALRAQLAWAAGVRGRPGQRDTEHDLDPHADTASSSTSEDELST